MVLPRGKIVTVPTWVTPADVWRLESKNTADTLAVHFTNIACSTITPKLKSPNSK